MKYQGNTISFADDIQAVTFDAVGTLIVTYPSVGEIYAGELGMLGYHLDPEQLQNNFVNSFRRFKNDHPGSILDRESWHEIVADTLHDLIPGDDFKQEFEVLWEAFTRHEYWRVLPGVEATLQSLLKEGIRLFVLSNNDERLHAILSGLGIGSYFETVFVSSELGAGKPSVQIFQCVQENISVTPGSILHVGDNPVEDVQGALDAGWRAALVGPRSADTGSAGNFKRADSIRDLFFEK